MRSRALGLVLGHAADRVFGDPSSFHPVAGFGTLAHRLEKAIWTDDRPRGAAYTAVLVGAASGLGMIAERATRTRPVLHTLTTAAVTWSVLGGRSLAREAAHVRAHLDIDDLPAAREQLTHLVGRDTSILDVAGVSRATVESVAENTSDAVVAPLLAGAAAGIPGLMAYRAANTLDAMVGHRSARHERFGWASARLDDVLNLVPARVAAGLAAALAPTVSGGRIDAVRAWRRDARHHPSPNAGPVEAAFAGALDVQLGGVNVYGDRTENRHTLGEGRPATPDDIGRAVRLADHVDTAAVVVAAVIALRPRRPRPLRR